MAVSSTRAISITLTGDVNANFLASAATNAASSGAEEVKTLASGLNTITPPVLTATGVTIVPPSGNTATMTLKGVTGDTGVVLHKTDPTSLGLDSPVTTFALTCSAMITGVRFIWS